MISFILLLFSWTNPGEYEVTFGASIPEETWQIQADPALDAFDAIIIKDVTTFDKDEIRRYRKIRILNENGKTAAEFVDNTGQATQIKGRVVDRNGEETVFNQKEDLIEVLAFKTRSDKSKSRIVVPPGLSSDCLVEFSWTLPATGGLPKGSLHRRYNVPDDFYCLEKRFVLTKYVLNLPFSFFMTQYVWKHVPNGNVGFNKENVEGNTILTYTNIPAEMSHPFGNQFLDSNGMYFLAFKTYLSIGSNSEGFWTNISDRFKNLYFGSKFKQPPAYKSWLEQLKSRLTGTPVENMEKVCAAIMNEVSNVDMLSPREKLEYETNNKEVKNPAKLAGTVFKRGFGNDYEIVLLTYHTAKLCGIPFELVFPSNRWGVPLEPKSLNTSSLDSRVPFFGVDSGSGYLMVFGPHYTNLRPGYIPTKHQGVPALVVDPDKPAHRFENIVTLGASAHQSLSKYQMRMDGNGKLNFQMNRQLSGEFEAGYRRSCYPLKEEERAELILESWEHLADWDLEDAEITGCDTLATPIQINLSGVSEFSLDDGWISLDPFPVTGIPIENPNIWPKKRTQPIILDRQSTHIDLTILDLPEGWIMRGKPSWKKSNQVGDVSFAAIQEGNQLKIRRDIVIKKDMLPANAEKDLKFFVAWVDEAFHQTIGIAPGGDQ